MSRKNLLELAGHLTLTELVEKWQEIELNPLEDWIEYPPQDFLDFVENYPPTPFDLIPESENYLKQPSFLITQAHRLWQTSSRVFAHLKEMNAKRFIDLGSFPFFLPLILRDYFGYEGEIIATVNLSLNNEAALFLANKRICTPMLDLDPFVSDPYESSPRLPFNLEFSSNSADLILASHVVEHLYHPKSLVQESFRLLKKGGKLMITTDNAMMVDTFANYIAGYGYTFEPIESTAAMAFGFWRGHVRFFTERDLSTLLKAGGFSEVTTEYFHCFYEVFYPQYFKENRLKISEWKAELLKTTPWLRNDICVTATT